MIVNFAQRAHNMNYETDYIVRSLLDTDWYKLAMLQFIWKHFRGTRVRFSLINRSRSVRLAEIIDEAELRRQLDHVRSLRFARSELVWLAGNTFAGKVGIFDPDFIAWLRDDFRMPEYTLSKADGQWRLDFEGPWELVTMWEIYALSIINELKTRAGLKGMSDFELDILYAKAKAKLWGKIERLRGVPGLKLADFGTRRRHSFLWQDYVVRALRDELGEAFVGTSNAYIAFRNDLEAIGTNAHELAMVLAALARTPAQLKASQYEVLRLWQETYGGALLIMLPDAYGTTQFLRDAPDWVADWTGMRIDSKNPYVAGDEYIAWLESRGRDPRHKVVIPSDGLDVDDILGLHAYFGGAIADGLAPGDFKSARDFLDPSKWTPGVRIRDSEGWGTLATNDLRGCHPRGLAVLDPLSLVCKVSAVEVDGAWKPAVKLSDNYTKATGPADEIARYREVFGADGVENAPVVV